MYIKKRKRNTLFSKQFKRKGENLLISKKFERTDDPDLGGFKNEFTSLLGFFLWYWPFQNHLNLVISNIWCNHVIIFFFLNVSLVSFHQMWQGFYPPSFFRGVGRNGIGVSLSLSISTTGFRKWKTVRLSLPFLSLSPSSLSRWRRSEGRLSVLVATNSLYGFQRLQMLWICVGK